MLMMLSAQMFAAEGDSAVENFTYEGVIPSDSYHHQRGGLSNCYNKFTQTKEGVILFLGGSITHNPGWRDNLCEYFTERFPDTKFTFVNAGIPSEGSTSAAFRLERDVLSYGSIDLLFEEAAVNDRDGGELRTTQTTRTQAMEGVVRRVRESNPMVDIVMMQFVDPQKIESYTNGKVPLEIRDFERVAEHYNIPSINLAKEVTERIAAGEFTWADDFKNLHPSPFGQSIYARSMRRFLDVAFKKGESSKKMVKHKLPKKLDELCYDKGKFISIESAVLGAGWSIDPAWSPSNGQQMRDINDLDLGKPCIVTREQSGEMTLEFVGSAIGIVALSGSDAGRINYSIDGVEYDACDLSTGYSLVKYLPRYFTLATNLDPGQRHRLTITLADSANPRMKGNACYIVRFFVNGDVASESNTKRR